MREIRLRQHTNPYDNFYIQHIPLSYLADIARGSGEPYRPHRTYKPWVIVLVRDPRDVAISAAYYCMRNDSDIDQIRISWNMPDIPVDSEAECLAYFKKYGSNTLWWDDYVEHSLRIPHILVRYEDLVERPYSELTQLVDSVGPSFASQETIEKAVEGRRFTQFSNGRSRGVEDKNHHYRKGVPGDWMAYFTEEENQAFYRSHKDEMDLFQYWGED
jgi:hypothetical protein